MAGPPVGPPRLTLRLGREGNGAGGILEDFLLWDWGKHNSLILYETSGCVWQPSVCMWRYPAPLCTCFIDAVQDILSFVWFSPCMHGLPAPILRNEKRGWHASPTLWRLINGTGEITNPVGHPRHLQSSFCRVQPDALALCKLFFRESEAIDPDKAHLTMCPSYLYYYMQIVLER